MTGGHRRLLIVSAATIGLMSGVSTQAIAQVLEMFAPGTIERGEVSVMGDGQSPFNGIAPGYIRTELNEALLRDAEFNAWVERRTPGLPAREDKIAAIGVKLRRWVSFHGISLNVEPDLGHFSGIVPCGVTEHGVTSLVDLGLPVTMDEADAALRASFAKVFGDVTEADAPV